MTTGFFGKIPATGDFVSWNLPRNFVDRWDRWMSMELKARPDEGELDTRAWRFVVPAGIFCDQICAGVWRMSEDRVGRRYPFVISAVGDAIAADDAWYDSIAHLVNAAVVEFWTTPELVEQLKQIEISFGTGASSPIAFWSVDWEVQELTFADIHELAERGLPMMRAERPDTEVLI